MVPWGIWMQRAAVMVDCHVYGTQSCVVFGVDVMHI